MTFDRNILWLVHFFSEQKIYKTSFSKVSALHCRITDKRAFSLFLIYAQSHYTKSFVVTLALLPAVVCVVIMMVNGNVGAGVAVAGAFSLVRFRSVPGSAKEIGTIFLAMAAELISGMGYLGYAVLFSLVVGAAMFLLNTSHFGGECL